MPAQFRRLTERWWRREPSREEYEELLRTLCRPGGTTCDMLRLMIIVLVTRLGPAKITAHARRHGVEGDKVRELLRGDLEFGISWDVLRRVLDDAGAFSTEIALTGDLYHECFEQGHRTVPKDESTPEEKVVPPITWTGQNCSIFFTDIIGYGSRVRTDTDRQRVRTALYEILERAFRDAGIDRESYHMEDRGDGVLIVVAPDVPTGTLIFPLVSHIVECLYEHNESVTEALRIGLRVALDVGPVVSDRNGVEGRAIINAARLLEVNEFKDLLAASDAYLGLIVSEYVYSSIVVQGHTPIAPSNFHMVRSRVKESRLMGWIYIAPPAAASTG